MVSLSWNHIMDQITEIVQRYNSVDLAELEQYKNQIIELVTADDPRLAEDALGSLSRLVLTEVDLNAITVRMQSRSACPNSVVLAFFSILSRYKPLDATALATIESWTQTEEFSSHYFHHLSAISMHMKLPESSPITDTVYRHLEGSNANPNRSVRILYNLSRYISSDRLLNCVEAIASRIAEDRLLKMALDKIHDDIITKKRSHL